MPKILTNLLLSKKFFVAFLTVIGAVATYAGWHVDPLKILVLASPIMVYIGAQGWADAGKEKALVEQDTQLKSMKMAQDHEAAMVFAKAKQSGFCRLGLMVVLSVVVVVAGAFLASCTKPAALRAGQCVLDSGVFGDVLVALAQADYAKAVEDLALRDAPELIDCALLAVASPPPGPGSGSGSALPAARATPSSAALIQRAREVLAARRASSK